MTIYLIAAALMILFFALYPRARRTATEKFEDASRQMLKHANHLIDDREIPVDLRKLIAAVSLSAHKKRVIFILAFGLRRRAASAETMRLKEIVDALPKEKRDVFMKFADAAFRVAMFSRVWGFYLCLPRMFWLSATRLQIRVKPVSQISSINVTPVNGGRLA